MTDPFHKMAMDAIGLAAQLLTPQAEYLGQLIEAERSMHSYLHITDPTMYRDAIHSDSLGRRRPRLFPQLDTRAQRRPVHLTRRPAWQAT